MSNDQYDFFEEDGIDEADFEITESADAECYKCGLYRKVNSVVSIVR